MKVFLLSLLLLSSCCAQAQTPAAPAGAAQVEMQRWITGLDTTWQDTFTREVTAPYDAEMAKLRQQYVTAAETNIAKLSSAGNLDLTLEWKAERDRFALAKDVPAEDEEKMSAALKQLRTGWRTQAARLEKERAVRAKAVLARFDQVLAQAQKQLTQSQRFDDALLVKSKRDEVATRWTPAAPASVAVVAATPSAPGGKGSATPAAKGAKLSPHEVLGKLLAAGAQVNIGEYRSRKEMHQVSDAPEKFAFYDIHWRPRKDGAAVTDDDLAVLESIESLKGLALHNLEITDAGLEHVRALRGLPYLLLENLPKITAAGLKVLTDLPALETIVLESLADPEVAIKAAAANKHLVRLDLGGMPISDAALTAVGASVTLTNVTLEKGATGIAPAGIAHLAKMRRLTTLTFVDFSVDDALAAEVGKIDGLQHLDILQSALTEAGAVSLGKLRNLTELRLTTPPVTPVALAALKKLKLLKSITVGRQTPAEDAEKLRAALKGVEIKL